MGNTMGEISSSRSTTRAAQVSLNGVTAAGRKDWHSAANGAVLSSNLGRQGRAEILPRRLCR
jgi:hypothetical protein